MEHQWNNVIYLFEFGRIRAGLLRHSKIFCCSLIFCMILGRLPKSMGYLCCKIQFENEYLLYRRQFIPEFAAQFN